MSYVTRPNIPDSPPYVLLHDRERGDAFEYIKKCYEYLDSKGIKTIGSLRDYDNSWTMEDMEERIYDLEEQIKEIEEDEKKKPEPPDNAIQDLLNEMSENRVDIEKIQKEMIPQRKIDVMAAKIESLINTLNEHTQQITDLMRKENESEAPS